MLPKINRGLKPTNIRYILRKGRAFKYTSIKVLEIKAEKFQLSVSISRKINKKAVVRNNIRRQINALFINESYDKDKNIVIIVKQNDINQIKSDVLKYINE